MKRKIAIRDARPSPTLVSNLVNGDLNAYKEIYHLYVSKVFNFIRRFLLSKEDAEEITQDVFLKLWEKHSSLDVDKSISSYLFTIAQHKIIDKYRQYSVAESRIKKIIGVRRQQLDIHATEHLMDFNELNEIIHQLVEELPQGRKAVFKLSRENGLSYREIAGILKISEGTVEKQMSHALQTLRAKLNARYGVIIET